MSRLYANENLAAELIEALQQFGYDVLLPMRQVTLIKAFQTNRFLPQQPQTTCYHLQIEIILSLCIGPGVEHEGIVVCKDDPDARCWQRCFTNYLTSQRTLQNRLIRVLERKRAACVYSA